MAEPAFETETNERPLLERVVTAVAETRDADPVALDPLYRAIDPDALERLFADRPSGRSASIERLSFSFAGCDVTVSGDGTVSVDPTE